MTKEEKLRILELRDKGLSYGNIAKEMGMNKSTVQMFILSIKDNAVCKCCGASIVQRPKVKKKIFCDVRCKNKWWNSHHDEIKNKTMHSFVCLNCGGSFERYGIKNRKYCSLDCYYKAVKVHE